MGSCSAPRWPTVEGRGGGPRPLMSEELRGSVRTPLASYLLPPLFGSLTCSQKLVLPFLSGKGEPTAVAVRALGGR